MSISHKAVLICILSGVALRTGVILAGAPPAAAKIDTQTQEQTEEKRKTLMADAIAALAGRQGALMLLDAGKRKEALAALERAISRRNQGGGESDRCQ
jgi:hypothetical protein